MSDFNLDDDLIHEYLAESREHLVTIETDLLAIEQAGAAIDERLVNRVFRAAHSIKGGAGFFDLLQIKELAHRTENVLDLVRERQLVPNSEIVSILLLAFDKLRSLIADYRESNQADISEFTAALARVAEDTLGSEQKGAVEEMTVIEIPGRGRKLTASVFDLDRARAAGKQIYALELDLIHDVQRQGRTPLEMLNRLMECGGILNTVFDLESAGTLEDEPSSQLMLDVLYTTALDSYSLAEISGLAPERVHAIGKRPVEVSVPVLPVTPVPAAPVQATADPVEAPVKNQPAAATQAETTLRLNVALLDSLMTLAGELVLGRNQLNEALRNADKQGIRAGAHRVSLVTSELQEAVCGRRHFNDRAIAGEDDHRKENFHGNGRRTR